MIDTIESGSDSILLDTHFGSTTKLVYLILAIVALFFGVKNILKYGELGASVTAIVFFVIFFWCAGSGGKVRFENGNKTIKLEKTLFFITHSNMFSFSEVQFIKFDNSKIQQGNTAEELSMEAGRSESINVYLKAFQDDPIKIFSIHKDDYRDVKRLEKKLKHFGLKTINNSSRSRAYEL